MISNQYLTGIYQDVAGNRVLVGYLQGLAVDQVLLTGNIGGGGSPSGTAGGDLQGTYPNPSVNKVQGVLVAAGVANALGNPVNSAGGVVVPNNTTTQTQTVLQMGTGSAALAPIMWPTEIVASPATLVRWRAAVQRVRQKQGNASIACVGDSTTYGTGAPTVTQAYPAQLAQIIDSIATPAQESCWFGDRAATSTGAPVATFLNSNDPRLTLSSHWVGTFIVLTLGGHALYAPSAGGNSRTISFAPTTPCDSVDVYFFSAPSQATVAINVDGGATAGTIDTSAFGFQIPAKATVTFARGIHTINLATTTTGDVYIIGMVARDSTTKNVSVYNLGVGSYTSTDYLINNLAGTPASQVNTLLAPDLVIINLITNDIITTSVVTSPAAWIANITAAIAAHKATSDILLVLPQPIQRTGYDLNIAAWRSALYALALSQDVALIDFGNRNGTFTKWAAAGMASDALHPNRLGYGDEASAIRANLVSAQVYENLQGDVGAGGNVVASTAGKGLQVKEGSNAKQGTGTLALGTVTIANTSVTANSRILITGTSINSSSAIGSLRVTSKTAGTSFTVTSLSTVGTTVTGDLSSFDYEIFEPAP